MPRVAFVEPAPTVPSRSVDCTSPHTSTPRYDFAKVKPVSGMCRDTLIRTPEFDVRVETLNVGDLVMTEDHGPQPIRWITKVVLPADAEHAPIVIADRALGNVGTLRVSPDYRVVLKGWRSAKVAGAKAVLTAAQHLVNDRDIKRQYDARVTYYHLAFDRHEIIQANSMPTESL
ncbi:MAG: Hint domain-containing protein, partial [Pseudomonadota bacterium]